MKNKFHLILAFACLLCFTTSLVAQDGEMPDKPKAAKKAKGKKGKKSSPFAKSFGDAELTDAQKSQLTELASAKKEEMTAIYNSKSELVTKEDAKKIRSSVRKSVKSGLSVDEAQKAAWTEIGLSAEDQLQMATLNKQLTVIEAGVVKEIVATFSEEQKAAMKAGLENPKKGKGKKGKGKGKGKRGKSKKKPAEEEN